MAGRNSYLIAARWRRDLLDRDADEVREDISASIAVGWETYRGSKCVLGLLHPYNHLSLETVRSIMTSSTDGFLVEHLIPAMINRFRLQFLPVFGSYQHGLNLAFADPKLTGMARRHVDYLGQQVILKAAESGAQLDKGELSEMMWTMINAVPIGVLALLTADQEACAPNGKRVFSQAMSLREELAGILDPAGLGPGRLLNELNPSELQKANAWLDELTEGITLPWPRYCEYVKSGWPWIVRAGSFTLDQTLGAGGAPDQAGLGTRDLEADANYIANLLAPNQKYRVAISNYSNLRHQLSKARDIEMTKARLSEMTRSVLGLELVI